MHAEEDGLRRYINYRNNRNGNTRNTVDIYCFRVDINGQLRNSRPCFDCANFLRDARMNMNIIVKNIYYSDENGNIISIRLKDLCKNIHKCLISRGNRE